MKSTARESLNGHGPAYSPSVKWLAPTHRKSSDWQSRHTTTSNSTDSLVIETGIPHRTRFTIQLRTRKINFPNNTETPSRIGDPVTRILTNEEFVESGKDSTKILIHWTE
jgi:hypothetical protein